MARYPLHHFLIPSSDQIFATPFLFPRSDLVVCMHYLAAIVRQSFEVRK
jgi:hypothetical protein